MDRPLACFEISSRAVKLLVGYQLDTNPIILYTREEPIEGMIVDGRIVDKQGIINVLKTFKNIDDKDKKIKLNISETYLVLPSFGLGVYQNNKTTNVVSNDNVVARIDIANVVSLVQKEEIPSGNVFVDIIPDEFILDNGAKFVEPPIGEPSKSITIRAKVHTLPGDILSSYIGVMNDAGFRVKKSAVSAYCYSELYSKYESLPKTFVLLDIGARISVLTFIGNGSAFSSTFFTKGGELITDAIVEKLHIDPELARKIKEENGFNPVSHSYNPILAIGKDEYGNKIEFRQPDLNSVVVETVENYCTFLRNSITTLLAPYRGRFDNIPVLITGGGSKLIGLLDLFKEYMKDKEFCKIQNLSVGGTNPSYSALVGLVSAVSNYKGSLADNQHGVRNLTRSDTNKETTSDDEI